MICLLDFSVENIKVESIFVYYVFLQQYIVQYYYIIIFIVWLATLLYTATATGVWHVSSLILHDHIEKRS